MVLQGFGGRGEQMSIKLKMILTGAVIVIVGLGAWGFLTSLAALAPRLHPSETFPPLLVSEIKTLQRS